MRFAEQRSRTENIERSGRPLEEGGLLGSKHSGTNPGNVLEQPKLDRAHSRLRVSRGIRPVCIESY